MMNAFDRDAISGWGAVVHVIEKDKVRERKKERESRGYCGFNIENLHLKVFIIVILDALAHFSSYFGRREKHEFRFHVKTTVVSGLFGIF